MGRSDGEKPKPTVMGIAMPNALHAADHHPHRWIGAGTVDYRQPALRLPQRSRMPTRASPDSSTRECRARARQCVTDLGVTGEGEPNWPHHRLPPCCVHRPALWRFLPWRLRSRTGTVAYSSPPAISADNPQQDGGQNAVADHTSDNRAPGKSVCVLQCRQRDRPPWPAAHLSARRSRRWPGNRSSCAIVSTATTVTAAAST